MSHSHDVLSGYLDGPSWMVPCKSVKTVLPPHFACEVGRYEHSTKTKPNHWRRAILHVRVTDFCKTSFTTEMSQKVLKISSRVQINIIPFQTTGLHQVQRHKKHSTPTSSLQLQHSMSDFPWVKAYDSHPCMFGIIHSSWKLFINLGHLWHVADMTSSIKSNNPSNLTSPNVHVFWDCLQGDVNTRIPFRFDHVIWGILTSRRHYTAYPGVPQGIHIS